MLRDTISRERRSLTRLGFKVASLKERESQIFGHFLRS